MTTTSLKILAIILMTLDHIGKFILNSPAILNFVGRLAAPLFIFCCVWGLYYTKNRKKYILRLYVSSILMSIIDYILFTYFPTDILVLNNFFRTLFLIAVLISIYEITQNSFKKRIILYACFIIWQIISSIIIYKLATIHSLGTISFVIITSLLGNILQTEGAFLIPLALGMYIFKFNKKHFSTFYILYFAALLFNNVFNLLPHLINNNMNFALSEISFFITDIILGLPIQELTLTDTIITGGQWAAVLALPIILKYNHRKGNSTKYFFYLYYPLHIAVLYLFRYYLISSK